MVLHHGLNVPIPNHIVYVESIIEGKNHLISLQNVFKKVIAASIIKKKNEFNLTHDKI